MLCLRFDFVSAVLDEMGFWSAQSNSLLTKFELSLCFASKNSCLICATDWWNLSPGHWLSFKPEIPLSSLAVASSFEVVDTFEP